MPRTAPLLEHLSGRAATASRARWPGAGSASAASRRADGRFEPELAIEQLSVVAIDLEASACGRSGTARASAARAAARATDAQPRSRSAVRSVPRARPGRGRSRSDPRWRSAAAHPTAPPRRPRTARRRTPAGPGHATVRVPVQQLGGRLRLVGGDAGSRPRPDLRTDRRRSGPAPPPADTREPGDQQLVAASRPGRPGRGAVAPHRSTGLAARRREAPRPTGCRPAGRRTPRSARAPAARRAVVAAAGCRSDDALLGMHLQRSEKPELHENTVSPRQGG